MTIGNWETCNWPYAVEQPIECYRLKAGRGTIYLHLRARVRYEERSEGGFDKIRIGNLWEYCQSFGANSDDSCSGCIQNAKTLDEAKTYITSIVIPRLKRGA